MNEKEIMKKAISRMVKKINQRILWCSAIELATVICSILCGLAIPKGGLSTILGLLAVIIWAVVLGLEVQLSLRSVEAEGREVFNIAYMSLSKHEATLDEILDIVEKEETKDKVLEYVGKKRKSRVADDLALEQLIEKDWKHIPML